jgi:hypothetical protein
MRMVTIYRPSFGYEIKRFNWTKIRSFGRDEEIGKQEIPVRIYKSDVGV